MKIKSNEYMYTKSLGVFSDLADKLIGKDNVKYIVEIGARDCRETLAFQDNFSRAEIYTFECNPDTLPLCRERVANISNIHLIEKAVSDKDGKLTFYQTDNEKTKTSRPDGNPGASSLFKANPDYPLEKYVQKEITVDSTTLSSFCREVGLSQIDLMWLDIQGAELMALKAAGDYLSKIKLIHTEVEFYKVYMDQPLYKDIRNYLAENGFRLVTFASFGKYAADAIFVNTKLIPVKTWPEPLLFSYEWLKEKITGKSRGAMLKLKRYLARPTV